jgi:transcription antitermination factor NusG
MPAYKRSKLSAKPVKKVRCMRCKRSNLKSKMVKRILSDVLVCHGCSVKYPEMAFCAKCNARFPAEKLDKAADGQIFCEQHMPERVKKVKPDTFGWYVLQVEPGRESKIKKDILRRLKIENKKHLCKRLLIPKKFEEKVVSLPGKLVVEGKEPTQRQAVFAAQCKLASLESEGTGVEYRYSIFRSRGVEKGREGNDFTWQIKTVPLEKQLKTLQVKKFPGYLLCQIDYGADMKAVFERTRGAWGLLLQPVVVGHLIEVKQSKKTMWWNWKVRTPDSKDIVVKGGPRQDKDQARSDAEMAKAKIEEFKPTALKTREAAEILIQQKTVNAIARNPEEINKANINFRVGSDVEVIYGQFKGVKSKVMKIDREDKTNVKVWIDIPVLGHPVPVEVAYWELKTVSY